MVGPTQVLLGPGTMRKTAPCTLPSRALVSKDQKSYLGCAQTAWDGTRLNIASYTNIWNIYIHLPCNVQKWWNIVYLHIREVPVVLDSWPIPLLKHNGIYGIILYIIVSILRNLYIEKAPVHHWGTGPRNGDPRIARLLLEQRCDPDASNMQPADSRVFLFMLFDLRHPKKSFGYWPTVNGIQQNEQINILMNKNGNGPNCLRPREAQMDWPF